MGALEVVVHEVEVAAQDGEVGMAHQTRQGDEVNAVAEGLHGEGAAEIMDAGDAVKTCFDCSAADDLAQARGSQSAAAGSYP